MPGKVNYVNNTANIKNINSDIITATNANFNSINTSGNISGSNVYGTNFNLNSFLNNFQSNIVGTDKFELTVDSFGNLKIVPKLALQSSSYNATVSISNRGKFSITGDDYPSCIYMLSLITSLINPIDTYYRKAVINAGANQNYDPASVFGISYVRMKLDQLYTDELIPPRLLSVATAFAKGHNDSIPLLISSHQQIVKPLTVLDALVCITNLNTVYNWQTSFNIGSNYFAASWFQYVLFQNNYSSSPSFTQNVGIPNSDAPTMSSNLLIGKDYLSDAKGVKLGSPHWFNLGTYDFHIVDYTLTKDNISFSGYDIMGVPWIVPNAFRNSQLDQLGGTVGSADFLYYPYVNLVGTTGAAYNIGTEVYPIEFEGPVRMNWPLSTGTITTTAGVYAINTSTGTLSLSIPRTKYGPIVSIDTTNNRAYCCPNEIDKYWIQSIELILKEFIFNTSVDQSLSWLKQYGSPSESSNDGNLMDKDGYIAGYNCGSRAILPYSKIYKNASNSLYNPKTINDISFFNNASAGVGAWNFQILNGSDPDVYLSLCDIKNRYGSNNLIKDDPDFIINTGRQTTVVQNSNTQVIDLSPAMNYNINNASIDIQPNPYLFLNLAGIMSGPSGLVSNPLENTRIYFNNTYLEIMNQIMTYQQLQSKAKWNYSALYKTLGLINFSSTGSVSFNNNVNEWINPTIKLTKLQAQNIDFDKTAYNQLRTLPGIVSHLSSYFASNQPNWSNTYLAGVLSSLTTNNFITASQATGAITQAACQDAVNVLQNWDYTYNINSVGTLLATQFWYRVFARSIGFRTSYLSLLKSNNSLVSSIGTSSNQYQDNSTYIRFDTYNAFAPTGSKYTWDMAVPNFTGPVGATGTYQKLRELTENDRWSIFIKRLAYPFGFDPTQVFEYSNGLATQVTNGQMVIDCFLASLVDIMQMRDSIKVAYVNADNSLSYVTNTARTDTPENNLADKIRRQWGIVHTAIVPFDYDSTGNLNQYPLPYPQDSWAGGCLTELRTSTNFSIVSGGLPQGIVTGVTLPGVSPSGAYTAGTATNKPSGIIAASMTRSLYRDGYLLVAIGGSANCYNNVVNMDGTITYKERNSFGINALNSLSYRKSFYELQNDLYTNDTTVYSLSSTAGYNRNTFASSLQFKPSAQEISW